MSKTLRSRPPLSGAAVILPGGPSAKVRGTSQTGGISREKFGAGPGDRSGYVAERGAGKKDLAQPGEKIAGNLVEAIERLPES